MSLLTRKNKEETGISGQESSYERIFLFPGTVGTSFSSSRDMFLFSFLFMICLGKISKGLVPLFQHSEEEVDWK